MSEGAAATSRGGSKLPRVLSLVAVVGFLALLVYGLLIQGADPSIDEGLAEGRAPLAPEFALDVLARGSLPPPLARDVGPALADGRLGLDELRGTPFVLNFWASWCNPCREEAPVLERGWRGDGARGVLYLGLNMQDLTDDARGFLEEFDVTYPSIRDPGDDVATAYGATGIPETYFVSARGGVVAHVIGVVSEQQLDAGARAAKNEDVIGSLTGGARRPQR